MTAIGTVHVTMEPEIREAIDFLAPVVKASVQLFDCLCEFDGEPMGESACAEWRDAWGDAVLAYKRRQDAKE